MLAPDIERREQHRATNPRLRQAIVFGSMAAGTARAAERIAHVGHRPDNLQTLVAFSLLS